MSSPTPQKKKGKNAKDQIQLFPAPDIESLVLDENILFDCALRNDYATICGAFDAKEHPLAAYIVEKGLFNRRNQHGKTAFDLATLAGNKDFLKAVLERSVDKLDENVWSLRGQLRPAAVAYNFFHYACIWGHLDICKFLVDHPKLVVDPAVELPVDAAAVSAPAAGQTSSKKDSNAVYLKSLGTVLLRTRAKTGETPRQLAKRYLQDAVVDFLTFAEKRQAFVDYLAEVKATASDPEKHQNKLPKDDKKRLDKLCAETLDWIEKNKGVDDISALELKVGEVEEQTKPILERLATKIAEAAAAAAAAAAANPKKN